MIKLSMFTSYHIARNINNLNIIFNSLNECHKHYDVVNMSLTLYTRTVNINLLLEYRTLIHLKGARTREASGILMMIFSFIFQHDTNDSFNSLNKCFNL